MNTCPGNIKIFTCNAHVELARQIARELGIGLGLSEISRFSDGEISLKIDETVRGADVYIVQSTCPPVNENIMELLIMMDALRRASAGRITAVMPYFAYARQDRKARARDPISAKLMANIITTAGADRVLTMDLHCAQIQGFFDIPVDHLRGQPLYAQYCQNNYNLRDCVVVSPDLGSVTRSRTLAERLDVPLAIVEKRRQKANVSEVMNIIGGVEGKDVILCDDMIDTAGTITNAADALKSAGARTVYACCTHGVLSGPAVERIAQSAISELIILDTIPLPAEKRLEKVKVLSIASLFASAISRIHEGLSISRLFEN